MAEGKITFNGFTFKPLKLFLKDGNMRGGDFSNDLVIDVLKDSWTDMQDKF